MITLIRLIEVFCSPSTGSGQGFYVGATKVDHQADGMVEYNRETEDCRFGVGFVGGASRSGPIQWLALKCESIAGPVPDKPPLEVDNGDNGNGVGGATAATDTTIYDQPEGNDIAYLSAGDPVTIVSCSDNNWCQISKPRRGWVWADDLNR